MTKQTHVLTRNCCSPGISALADTILCSRKSIFQRLDDYGIDGGANRKTRLESRDRYVRRSLAVPAMDAAGKGGADCDNLFARLCKIDHLACRWSELWVYETFVYQWNMCMDYLCDEMLTVVCFIGDYLFQTTYNLTLSAEIYN